MLIESSHKVGYILLGNQHTSDQTIYIGYALFFIFIELLIAECEDDSEFVENSRQPFLLVIFNLG